MAQYKTLGEAVRDMRERGFTYTFIIQNQALHCPDTGADLPPEQLTLVEQHRVQAPDEAEGELQVYGLRTPDNLLGLMTSTYATYDPTGFKALFGRCRRHPGGYNQ